MTMKELIAAEINTLSEDDLHELYNSIQQFIKAKRHATAPSLMSKLKRVKIYAPTDFAANLDLYVSGEKNAR